MEDNLIVAGAEDVARASFKQASQRYVLSATLRKERTRASKEDAYDVHRYSGNKRVEDEAQNLSSRRFYRKLS